MEDKLILRELANKYFEAANSDKNRKNIILHKMVNDLKQPRPIVLIDEIPWHEMNINDELTLMCEDSSNKKIEAFFRRNLYKWNYMPADMVLTPYYSVKKDIHSTGIGFERKNNEHEEDAKAHTFVDQLATDEDIDKLNF
jgi:hypothetical protein